jgi:beta-glucosidase
VHHEGSKVDRPRQQLKAFARVSLKAGESKSVPLSVPLEDLAYWDENRGGWQVEADRVTLMVGASASDIRLQRAIQIAPARS